MIADLKAIETEAHSWSAPLAEPPERVWVSLRNQLEAEGIIKPAPGFEVQPAAAGGAWWSRWLPVSPRPVLAGAYLAALVAFSFGISGILNVRSSDTHVLSAENRPASSLLGDQLNSVESRNIAFLRNSNSPVAASLQQNLDIVDKQIALCEKSVSEEPDNEMARDFLYEAYQQKADLLAEISERGESGQ
jgi:hypothetical protein